MKTYYCDLGWEGGVIVMAASIEEAIELVKKDSYHKNNKEIILEELQPNRVYDLLGDS